MADELEGFDVCPDDPTDSSEATHADDASSAWPSQPAAATRSGESDPARATLAGPDPIRENAATVGFTEPGTIDHTAAGLTDALTKPLSTTDPSHVPAMPTVPGYDLLAPLGEGGMGVVWKARQTKLNRLVALKMPLGEKQAGSKELIRFLAEAESVAAVKHPHIVQVYEYGEVNGRPFLAMEYLPGGSLADRLDRSDRLDPKAAAELVATLACAIQAAHDLGIIHRDLKPANVLYDEHDQPKVTDFGLAKRVGGSNLTATQAVIGTPAYMAPEQARGDTRFVGTRADVYSLGVILFECLTRTRPFEAPDQLALLRKVADEEPERPGKRVPGLSRDVELICLKCLAKDPAERYPTAEALAGDLRRFTAGEPVSVRAAGVVERAAKWARRKPTLAATYTLGLLAVLLGGLGGAAVWQWRAAERALNVAEVARGEAVMARDGEKLARKQLAGVEYGRTMEVAHQEWRENNLAATVALLESTQADLRGWEWRYVHRLCHSDLLTLKGHTGHVRSASFSPDGSRILTASDDKTAKVWDAKTGAEVLTLKGHTEAVNSASFSPDGSRVLTGSTDSTAKVWDAKSGTEVLTLKGHTSSIFSASFSPDGSRVVTGSADKTAKVWDARRGAELLTLKGHSEAVIWASFSLDGSRAVTGSFDRTAKIWDARNGAEALTLKGHTHYVDSASFSPDGSRVLTASHDRTAKVWDAKSGAELLTLKGHINYVESASFSPDGSRVLTGSADKTAKVWDTTRGAEVLTLKGHAWVVNSASFSPDGSRVVTGSADSTAKVWDTRSGAEVLTLKGRAEHVISASFSPDGSRIVTASRDTKAKVWDAKTGAEVLALKGHRDYVRSASFSPDGSRILTGSADNTAKVWDARSGAEVLTLKGHTNALNAASFSPDGSRVVTGSGDKTAKVWDTQSGAEVLTLKGHTNPIFSAAFSPDGSRIVTGSLDQTAKIWDARSGAEVLTLKGHTHGVTSASFSPDGSRVVTGSGDKTAKVWDARSGAEVLTLKGHTDIVFSASFSPDGSRVLTGSHDETAKVWDATPINREFLTREFAPPPGDGEVSRLGRSGSIFDRQRAGPDDAR